MEEIEIFEIGGQTKPKVSVFDNDVPIVKVDDNIIRVYITTDIGDPWMYNELVHILDTAKFNQTVEFVINTNGGQLRSASMIMDAIRNTNATTVALLSGTVASAGTMVALSCDELVVGNYLEFLIHLYSGGIYGKGQELKAQQNFEEKQIERMFKDVYGGFLTDEELDVVISGSDLYFDEQEVLRRWRIKRSL